MAGFAYAPFFCEENVWHLAQAEVFASKERRVVVVSNDERKVPLWCQKAAPAPDQLVVWDYHVLLFVRDPYWRVYDLDSVMPWGSRFSEYFGATFRIVDGPFAPRFRVMDADTYVATLATDRSHMLHEGTYRAPPPPWPAIREGTNVMRFVDFGDPIGGEIVDVLELAQRFG